jgi:hypothetical protein
LGPRFTAGIDGGPVYSVSTLWLPYKWFFHGSQISRFCSKLVDFFYRYLIFAILSFIFRYQYLVEIYSVSAEIIISDAFSYSENV